MKTSVALLLASVCMWGCQSEQPSTEVVADTDSTDNTGFAEKFAESFADMVDFDIPPPGEIKDQEAKAVAEAMYAAYAACDTYSDTGTLEHETANMTFKTRYKKPNKIYFEFSGGFGSPNGPSAYWTKGDRGTSNYDIMGMKGTEEDALLTDYFFSTMKTHEKDWPLSLAIASFTGISMHTGMTVPTMIFPDENPTPFLLSFSDLVYEGTETIRGTECDVLYSEGWTERFWVDRETHLLMRVTNRFFMYDEPIITEYWPVVNEEIDDGDMVFDVPR